MERTLCGKLSSLRDISRKVDIFEICTLLGLPVEETPVPEHPFDAFVIAPCCRVLHNKVEAEVVAVVMFIRGEPPNRGLDRFSPNSLVACSIVDVDNVSTIWRLFNRVFLWIWDTAKNLCVEYYKYVECVYDYQ